MILEKPKFVYTGTKDQYSIKWVNTNKKAKLNSDGDFIAIIAIDNYGRIESIFKTPFDAVEYAKKRISVKSLPGQRTYATGKARVLFLEEETGIEYEAAIIQKDVKRYYEPVSRFIH